MVIRPSLSYGRFVHSTTDGQWENSWEKFTSSPRNWITQVPLGLNNEAERVDNTRIRSIEIEINKK